MSGLVWITGLPGAGKSYFSEKLVSHLKKNNLQPILLDGDKVREALSNQDYSATARNEVAMTYARLSRMLVDSGQLVVFATVSMFSEVREWNRKNISNYCEVYLKVDHEVLLQRDQKQLYSAGEFQPHSVWLELQEPDSSDYIMINNDESLHLEIIDSITAKLKGW